jgi:peptidylprolyl isomerase
VNRSETPLHLRRRAPFALAALAAAAVIAGCGSSGSSSTITVGNESSADNALIKAGGAASATTPTTTPSVKTPTSGPLSKEPQVTPPSGPPPTKLVTKDIVVGTGKEAKLGQTITVNYTGVLYHGGKQFDSSWKRGEPATFPLKVGGLIPGWTAGIPGMKVGGRRELVIPAALAYGSKGSGSTIPPNEPLVFVVDLLGTQ